jgi:hypothetical protein
MPTGWLSCRSRTIHHHLDVCVTFRLMLYFLNKRLRATRLSGEATNQLSVDVPGREVFGACAG